MSPSEPSTIAIQTVEPGTFYAGVVKKRPGPKKKPVSEKVLAPPKPIQTHRHRFYTVKFKLRVLSYWQHTKLTIGPTKTRQLTRSEVSQRFKIPLSNLTRWKANEAQLLSSNNKARSIRHNQPRKWTDMEKILYTRFIIHRKAGKIVRRGWFRRNCREILSELDNNLFRFSNSWFQNFLSCYNISLRFGTNKASKIPADYFDTIVNWLQYNRIHSQVRPDDEFGAGDSVQAVGRYRLRNICNMDQTPIPFEYLSGQTYNTTGESTVWIKASNQNGLDKRQAILQLTAFADGVSRVHPLIFFRGQGLGTSVIAEMKHYHPRVVVKFNPTAYANSKNMIQWIDEQLFPVLENQPTLLALDLFSGHRTEDVLDTLLAHDITVSVIPDGCTSLLQPLDISINRPFKDIFREVLEDRIDQIEKDHAAGKSLLSNSQVGRRRIATTWAVGEAWERFCTERTHVIIKAFRTVGLSLPVDGSADSTELSIKGLDTVGLSKRLKDLSAPRQNLLGDHDEIAEQDDENEAVDFEM